MIRAVPRPLLLCLALLIFASQGCGKTNSGVRPDGGDGAGGQEGGADHDGGCAGTPVYCVTGSPLGDGITCTSTGQSASCVDREWTCPQGTVDQQDCKCGEPGGGCAGEICTANGWVCPDAGADTDAGLDAPADGPDAGADTDAGLDVRVDAPDAGAADDGASPCKGPPPSCALGEGLGTGVVACTDIFGQVRCFEGVEGAYYSCPEGSVDQSTCTCGLSGLPSCSN
jgi:hypothetical protein